jgi:hypothetical protein
MADGRPTFGELWQGVFDDMDELLKGAVRGELPEVGDLFLDNIGDDAGINDYRKRKENEANTVDGQFTPLD